MGVWGLLAHIKDAGSLFTIGTKDFLNAGVSR